MRVKLIEDDYDFNLEKGDIFEAEIYDNCKVSLLKRESDNFDPECNAYIHQVLFFVNKKWVKRDCRCCVDYGE